MDKEDFRKFEGMSGDPIHYETNKVGNKTSLFGFMLFGEKGFLICDGSYAYGWSGSVWLSKGVEKIDSLEPIPYDCFLSQTQFRSVEETSSLYGDDYDELMKIKTTCFSARLGEVKKVSASDYPNFCPKCGAPAYIGLVSVDCSKCGKF